MNDRERFLNTMHFKEVDRIPYWDFGYWNETLERWYKEGLPQDVHLRKYFGLDRAEKTPVNLGMIPAFETEVLEEDEDTKIVIDSSGIKSRQLKKGSSIPQFIEFPVKTKKDFEEIKKRYNPYSEKRYPEYWEDYKRSVKVRDYPLGIHIGGFFGWLRDWMGLENLSIAFVEDKNFINEMLDFICDFILKVTECAVKEIELDFADFWEDMCYNKGPLISPKMFKEFLVPRYKKITEFLKKYGVDVVYVDCDGNIWELIPLWLEGGVNCMFPCEVRAGMDVVEMRKKFGKDLLIIGGINKIQLSKDKKAIEEEVFKKVPFMISQGGYIPTPDHRVPPDVPFENFLYYLELVKKISKGG